MALTPHGPHTCTHTDPVFVVNGKVTTAELAVLFPVSNVAGGYAGNQVMSTGDTKFVRELYMKGRGNMDRISSGIESANPDDDSLPRTCCASSTTLECAKGKVEIRYTTILQHLSYHLMCGDASGKAPGLTLTEDICSIIMSGAACNINHHAKQDVISSASQLRCNQLKRMAARLCKIMDIAGPFVDKLFEMKPSLLYHHDLQHAVEFLADNINKDQWTTFVDGGFWKAASDISRWQRAIEFLKANVDKDQWPTFVDGGFWKAASDISRWQRAIEFLEANVDKDKWPTFTCDGFWKAASDISRWQRAIECLENVVKAKRQTFASNSFWKAASDIDWWQ